MDVVSYWYMISDKARETLGPPAWVPSRVSQHPGKNPHNPYSQAAPNLPSVLLILYLRHFIDIYQLSFIWLICSICWSVPSLINNILLSKKTEICLSIYQLVNIYVNMETYGNINGVHRRTLWQHVKFSASNQSTNKMKIILLWTFMCSFLDMCFHFFISHPGEFWVIH